LRSFEYYRPESLEKACQLLARRDKHSKVLAGGTDLLVQLKQNKVKVRYVISLRDIPDLKFIRCLPGGGIALGAMTPLHAIETSRKVLQYSPGLASAAAQIASVQLRTRATIGGNLCNAAPSADMAPILLAHGAMVVAADSRRQRSIPIEDFFLGPGRTDLKQGEILTEVQLPAPKQPCFTTYLKACRTKMDIALVGVAILVSFDPSTKVCRDLRIGLAAVAPTPILVKNLYEICMGSKLNDTVIAKIIHLTKQQARPISDIRATADYRQILVENLTSLDSHGKLSN